MLLRPIRSGARGSRTRVRASRTGASNARSRAARKDGWRNITRARKLKVIFKTRLHGSATRLRETLLFLHNSNELRRIDGASPGLAGSRSAANMTFAIRRPSGQVANRMALQSRSLPGPRRRRPPASSVAGSPLNPTTELGIAGSPHPLAPGRYVAIVEHRRGGVSASFRGGFIHSKERSRKPARSCMRKAPSSRFQSSLRARS